MQCDGVQIYQVDSSNEIANGVYSKIKLCAQILLFNFKQQSDVCETYTFKNNPTAKRI